MKTVIVVTILCLCPTLFSQSKEAEATPPKTKEANPTVFGIRLGEKLSIPECKRSNPKNLLPGYYDSLYTSAIRCYERDDARTAKPNAPIVSARVDILFPTEEIPHSVTFFDSISGQVVDGNLEYVTIVTCGLDCQDAALGMLKEKYGQPSDLTEEDKENGYGAVFTSHLAVWSQFANLRVEFHGTRGHTDEGIIYIMTSKGHDLLLERAKQQTQTGPKL